VAIPHARFQEINKPFGMLVRLRKPIDFDAVDGKPVDTVFLLLLPEAADGGQLSALASIARKLRNPTITTALRGVRDCAEMYQVLTTD
jgi:nitrogen PTS system EIIA component